MIKKVNAERNILKEQAPEMERVQANCWKQPLLTEKHGEWSDADHPLPAGCEGQSPCPLQSGKEAIKNA